MEPNPPQTTREVAETILLDRVERRKLFAFAYSKFGICADDAEDLLQETALELLRQQSYVRNAGAFVYAVFRSRCCRFIDGRRKSREFFGEGAALMKREAAPLGAEYFDRRIALHQALDTISPSCLRLLSAYYAEGQSLREAAKRLSLAYASVSKTISRCLKKLRRCII